MFCVCVTKGIYSCVGESHYLVLLVLLKLAYLLSDHVATPCFLQKSLVEQYCTFVVHLKKRPVAPLLGTVDETQHIDTQTLYEDTSCHIIQIKLGKSRILLHPGDYYT